MKKIITIAIIIILLIIIIFIKINYKSLKFGNNNNKSTDDIEKNILDIKSYELTANIVVQSNKNSNKYMIKEKYLKDNNICRQEVLEPENIKGVLFTYDGLNLKLENTSLNLSKIYENYPYLEENNITLISFINDYKEADEKKISKNEDEIIIELKLKNGNKYRAYKKLYISKKDSKPIKLEVQDITQKTAIYILYNEIKINNLQKEDILAFSLKEITNDI